MLISMIKQVKSAHVSLRNDYFLVIEKEKMPCIGYFFLAILINWYDKVGKVSSCIFKKLLFFSNGEGKDAMYWVFFSWNDSNTCIMSKCS